VTSSARRGVGRDTSILDDRATPGAASTRAAFDEPTLDQLLAEPIVRQLMGRDHTDEATVRHLLQEIAVARPALPPNDDPNMDDPNTIVRLLEETARLWRGLLDRELRAQLPGMTRARCAVLIQLAQLVGLNQATLAQILDIRPSTLARLLDRLEAAGFVARMPDPEDRRAHILALTAKALPIIECINDLTRKTDDERQLGISKAEACQLRILLCRLWSNLRSRLDEFPSSEPIRTRRHT
jgi:MarR family transcriptional regulator, transcriptional regulator for hemolysin